METVAQPSFRQPIDTYQHSTPSTSQAPASDGAVLQAAPLAPEADLDSTLIKAMGSAREATQQRNKTLKELRSSSVRYRDAPLNAYARLARARTRQEVSSASGYARRSLFQLKAALRQDADRAGEIRTAIAQLQKLFGRAEKKKRDLAREAIQEQQRRRALEESNRRKAMQLQAEQQRQRANRTIRENSYLHETVTADMQRAQREIALEQYKLKADAAAVDSTQPQFSAEAAAVELSVPDAAGMSLMA